MLKRAIATLWLALDEMDCMWLPQTTAWQLNERHYGALQGLNKQETADKHSPEQVHIWRRSYDTPPPEVDGDSKYHPRNDARYADIDPAKLPGSESLKMTLERVLPYWEAEIKPALQAGENVIISAHGNSLRALAKHLLVIGDKRNYRLGNPNRQSIGVRAGWRSQGDGRQISRCRTGRRDTGQVGLSRLPLPTPGRETPAGPDPRKSHL